MFKNRWFSECRTFTEKSAKLVEGFQPFPVSVRKFLKVVRALSYPALKRCPGAIVQLEALRKHHGGTDANAVGSIMDPRDGPSRELDRYAASA